MTAHHTILLAIPTLALHDAMGRDLLIGYKALKNAGFEVKIFAEFTPQVPVEGLVSKPDALALLGQTNTIFFYHMGVYWHLLPELLRTCRGKFLVKYHNMTPPRFFAPYDSQSVAATKLGLEQLSWLMHQRSPDAMLGDSSYNLQELHAASQTNRFTKTGNHVDVIAPFITVDDLAATNDHPEMLQLTRKSKTNILFVGRLVPNKGHAHLLATLKSYEQLYGPDVQLILCGGLSPGFKKYKDDLLRLADLGDISSKVKFVHDADGQKLGTLYRNSQVFLCMSEHEGFCVPVIEAQMMGLPVIAWDQAAVGSTVGDGGIVLKNLNYDVFATAIHRIQSGDELRENLVSRGRENAKKFGEDRLGQELVKFIKSL